MKILNENSNLPQNVALILGFFDGIHAGHREVIKNTPAVTKVLVTFSSSPAEYFEKKYKQIYSRQFNYELIEELGVDYIFEQNFKNIATTSAEDYLNLLITRFNPISITTGFNHTFGTNRQGTPEFLEKNQKNYKYFCTPPTKINSEIVCSTTIKKLIQEGNIEKANRFLTQNFTIISNVIEGSKIGRKIGFPTANMKYPKDIVKLPYGVYKIKALNKPAILNWGIKPTVGSEELLEVHIPNFSSNLYNKSLKIEIISKIREEKKFNNLEELKLQIEKDVQECLK